MGNGTGCRPRWAEEEKERMHRIRSQREAPSRDAWKNFRVCSEKRFTIPPGHYLVWAALINLFLKKIETGLFYCVDLGFATSFLLPVCTCHSRFQKQLSARVLALYMHFKKKKLFINLSELIAQAGGEAVRGRSRLPGT